MSACFDELLSSLELFRKTSHREAKDKGTYEAAHEAFNRLLWTQLDKRCTSKEEAANIRKSIVANHQRSRQHKPVTCIS